jgi:GTP-binding protein
MKIKNAKFMLSAASKSDLLEDDVPEIAFVGRSNVGKSSLINALCAQNKLAKTSQTPGRTRLVNYFSVNDDTFRFVDLPGYGYAKASKSSQKQWSGLIEEYLNSSTNLKVLLLLVDIRHAPNDLDLTMLSFAFNTQKPCVIVATKSDKVPKSKIYNQLIMLANHFKVGKENILPFSSENKQGKQTLLETISTYLEQ